MKDHQIVIVVENLTMEEAARIKESVEKIIRDNELEGEINQIDSEEAREIVSIMGGVFKRPINGGVF